MNPDKLDIKGQWKELLKPFLISPEFDAIYDQLRRDHAAGNTIYPASANFWKPFNLCRYEDLKVVIIADGPHNYKFKSKRSEIVMADGLALSTGYVNTEENPEVINEWYLAIEKDIHNGLNLLMFLNPDFSFLAEQGVLMLNSSFTAIEGGDNHYMLWRSLLKYILKDILRNYDADLAYILIGEQAIDLRFQIQPGAFVLKCEHPETSLKEKRVWNFNNIFSKTNEFLKKSRNMEILWVEEIPF